MPPKTANPQRARNRLRIIGGSWRGRTIAFADTPGLRPTPDRVRETLFNWLQAFTEGAHCLDLFAGSGALALEALSRGAASVTAIEQSPVAVRAIRAALDHLAAGNAAIVQADALAWLRGASNARFDIVFIDPPFDAGLVEPCLRLLAGSGVLAAGAWVYVEQRASEPLPAVPADWTLHREKRAGDVAYRLLRAP